MKFNAIVIYCKDSHSYLEYIQFQQLLSPVSGCYLLLLVLVDKYLHYSELEDGSMGEYTNQISAFQ